MVLEDPESDPAAETLASSLLDSGSADIVYVTRATHWWNRATSIKHVWSGQQIMVLTSSASFPSVDEGEQMVWLRVPRWKGMEIALRFKGRKTVGEVWPNSKILAGDPTRLWLRGLGGCRTGETIKEQGMEFVHICSGTFTMGSSQSVRADSDEEPAHEVTLDEYWIGRYEVTQAQYQGKGRDTRPATGITWFDAEEFCGQNGWRLPTEAEWEKAARAGTQTDWSFGDDERLLGDYAWFERNSSLEQHPVGTRKPNPWGLYDMQGNVWEWVSDWYGPYESEPLVSPVGPHSGTERVLRGGAAVFTAKYLRSAFRYKSGPLFRNRFIGFRCVRGPRRQP